MAPLPQLAGNRQRLDAGLLPPADFITSLMQISMVRTAEWDGELITHFQAQGARLSKAQVMRI